LHVLFVFVIAVQVHLKHHVTDTHDALSSQLTPKRQTGPRRTTCTRTTCRVMVCMSVSDASNISNISNCCTDGCIYNSLYRFSLSLSLSLSPGEWDPHHPAEGEQPQSSSSHADAGVSRFS
jgi:hypothetical protein